MPLLFGTFNRSTATAAEAELSQSLQTAFANFVKDPLNASPAPNWPAYESGFLGISDIPTLAQIAYAGNVGFGDFVKPVQPISKVSMRKLYPKTDLFIAGRLVFKKGRTMHHMGCASGFPPLRSHQMLRKVGCSSLSLYSGR